MSSHGELRLMHLPDSLTRIDTITVKRISKIDAALNTLQYEGQDTSIQISIMAPTSPPKAHEIEPSQARAT